MSHDRDDSSIGKDHQTSATIQSIRNWSHLESIDSQLA